MRREHDFYPTPEWATRELLKRSPYIGGTVLEPCVGRGDISGVLVYHDGVTGLVTNDLDRSRPLAHTHEDATDPWWWSRQHHRVNWVVTNPPFSVAHQIVPLAVKFALQGVAMLLRITYLEPCEGRGAWLEENPPTALYVLPRISFTGDGATDSATCAWFLWERTPRVRGIEVVNVRDGRQGSLLEPPPTDPAVAVPLEPAQADHAREGLFSSLPPLLLRGGGDREGEERT